MTWCSACWSLGVGSLEVKERYRSIRLVVTAVGLGCRPYLAGARRVEFQLPVGLQVQLGNGEYGVAQGVRAGAAFDVRRGDDGVGAGGPAAGELAVRDPQVGGRPVGAGDLHLAADGLAVLVLQADRQVVLLGLDGHADRRVHDARRGTRTDPGGVLACREALRVRDDLHRRGTVRRDRDAVGGQGEHPGGRGSAVHREPQGDGGAGGVGVGDLALDRIPLLVLGPAHEPRVHGSARDDLVLQVGGGDVQATGAGLVGGVVGGAARWCSSARP